MCESSNRRVRKQNALSKIVVFISAYASGLAVQTTKHYSKAIPGHSKESGGLNKPF